MTPRRPLRVLGPAELMQLRESLRVDEDNDRIGSTPEEKLAARPISAAEGKAAATAAWAAHQRKMRMSKPIVSGKIAVVAGAVAFGLFAVHAMVPEPWSWIAYVLACIAAALGGLGIQPPKFTVTKPILPAVLVPLVTSAMPFLYKFAEGLDGTTGEFVKIGVIALGAAAAYTIPLDGQVPALPATETLKK